MSDVLETIKLGEFNEREYRLQILIDYDPENPRENWDHVTGALTVKPNNNYHAVTPVHEFPGPLQDATERLVSPSRGSRLTKWTPEGGVWWDTDPDLVVRWARIFYGITLEWFNEDAGLTFWWVDPAQFVANWGEAVDGKVRRATRQKPIVGGGFEVEYEELTKAELERDIVRQDREVYLKWARGEVYGVALDREDLFVRDRIEPEDRDLGTDDMHYIWETKASLFGCYLDTDYTAQHVGLELAAELGDDGETEAVTALIKETM